MKLLDITIQPLDVEHVDGAAELHVQSITEGFISSLGIRFVKTLYESIITDTGSIGFVARRQGHIVGVVLFSNNLKGLYKSILKRKGLLFAKLLTHKVFSWKTVRHVLETLCYPRRLKPYDLPQAELMSLAVAESARGQGVGQKLVKVGLAECQRKGINQVKLLVADNNELANQLYRKCGFRCVTQIKNHNVLSNIYVWGSVANALVGPSMEKDE